MSDHKKIKNTFKKLKNYYGFMLNNFKNLDESGCAYEFCVFLKPIFYRELQIKVTIVGYGANKISYFMSIGYEEDDIFEELDEINSDILEVVDSSDLASLINKKLTLVKMFYGFKFKFLWLQKYTSKFTLDDVLKLLVVVLTLLNNMLGVDKNTVNNNRSSAGASRSPRASRDSNPSEKIKTNLYRVDKKICATCAYWCGGRDINSSRSLVTVEHKDALCLVSTMTKDPITNKPRGASPSNKAPHFGSNCKYHKRWQ